MQSSKLAKNTVLLAAGNILTKGLLFVMVPFFSSWLSTEDYGTFDLFCTYIALLIPVISLASGEAVFRFSVANDADKDKCRKYISNGLAIVAVNLLIGVSIILGIQRFTGWAYAVPFAALLIGEVINNYLQSYLRALRKLNIYSFCSAFSVVIIAGLVWYFVRIQGMGLSGILYGYALGYLLGDVCIFIVTRYHRYFDVKEISIEGTTELIKYSYPLIPNSASWWVINASDRLIIRIVMGVAANGVYAIAHKIPSICAAIFGVFNISWQQAAVEIVESENEEAIGRYFNDVYNSVIKRLLSLCIGILSLNYVLFNYIFDQRYIEAYKYSPILVTSVIFMLIAQFYGGIQISLKMPKENGISTIIGACVNVVVNILFIKSVGLYAAAFSTLVSYYVVMYIRKCKLINKIKLKINKENILYVAIFIYYAIASCFIQLTLFSVCNLMIACILFFYMNRDFAYRIKKKLLK